MRTARCALAGALTLVLAALLSTSAARGGEANLAGAMVWNCDY